MGVPGEDLVAKFGGVTGGADDGEGGGGEESAGGGFAGHFEAFFGVVKSGEWIVGRWRWRWRGGAVELELGG